MSNLSALMPLAFEGHRLPLPPQPRFVRRLHPGHEGQWHLLLLGRVPRIFRVRGWLSHDLFRGEG